MEYKNFLSRIRNVFPYLYYRCYQFYDKHENDGTSQISAYICMTVIEAIYVITFVIFPIDQVLFDGALGLLLRVSIAKYTRFGVILMLLPFSYLIYRLEENRRNRYNEMMTIWKTESLSQRRKKFWILILICVFPFIAFALYIGVFKESPQRPIYNDNRNQIIIHRVEQPKNEIHSKPPIQFDEIDDSHMWGIKQKKKEIRIVEEENQ